MISDNLYKFIKEAYASDQEILDAASKYYDNDDPDDPKRRWDHVLDDIEVAKKIRGRDLTPVELGTLAFHDSGYKNPKGYMWGLKNHPKLSRKIFKREAPGLGFNDDEIKHMAKVISYHMRTPKKNSPLLKDDLQMLMFGADEGSPKKPVDDARKYFMKGIAGRYPEVPDKTHPDFIKKLVERVRTFKDYSNSPGLEYYHRVYPNYHRDLYNYWHSDQIIKDYEKMLEDDKKGKSLKQKDEKKKKVKKAEFDLPDLQTNPKNKITRLLKNLKWGVRIDGKPNSQEGVLFKLDPDKKYEVIGDDNSDLASCVDLTNKVVKNMKGVGSLATMRNDATAPHLTPLFKYKGKYYLRSGSHKFSDPYDSLDEIGDRWFNHASSVPVPAYLDFYDIPAGETIEETDIRKVLDEVKRKAKKTYRKDYTDRPLYKKEKKASIDSPDDLKSLYDSLDYKILDRENNKPYDETSRDRFDKWQLMSPEEIQKHKIGICWDTAAMTDSELSRLGVPHENYYAHSVTDDPMAPTHSFNIYKDKDNNWKWLEGSWGKYKSNDWKDKDSKKLLKRIVKALEDDGGKQYIHKIDKFPAPGSSVAEFIKAMTDSPLYNSANKPMTFPKDEIEGLKGKDYLYTTRVSDDFDRYGLGDSVNTPWGDTYTIDSEDIYDDVKKHKFYKELTPEQKKLLKAYDKIKLIGLKKQAGKLYTYVDPEADLSKGLLSARLAPEDALMRRYPNSGAKNKKDIIKRMKELGDPYRADLIYALSSPIPDTANSRLLRFRANHRLVSYDTDKIKDLVKLLKRRYRKPPVEVTDVEPRKYIQWGREPKNGAGAFFYAPVYKVLTESGRIPPELLTMEDQDKYTIHGAILGCLGDHAKDFKYNITEDLPDDPWKAIINTGPVDSVTLRKFHKYHNVDVDKAGVPYYFLTKNDRTGDKAVWYSDEFEPIPINTKKQIEKAKQLGLVKGLKEEQLDFKFE